jgi:trypsin
MTRRLLLCAATMGIVLAAATSSASAAPGDTAEPRVVGGQTTTIEEYPWQAGLLIGTSGSAFSRQFCGGSLLTTRIVITAAHCLDEDPDCDNNVNTTLPDCGVTDPGGDGTAKIDPNDLEILLGTTRLSSATQADDYGVYPDHGAISIHPSFNNPVPFANDVGYVVLTGGVVESSDIETIMIAGDLEERDLWLPGVFTEISGWGRTIQGGSKSDTLRAASVPIVSDSACGSSAMYGGNFNAATMVCAGFSQGGVDTCQGDSGGPLQAPLQTPDGEYRLIGITSWGSGCAQPNRPGVYTRIAQDGGLRDDVEQKVSDLETAFGLPPEDVVGDGTGEPKSGGPKYPVPQTPVIPLDPGGNVQDDSQQEKADPFKKCRKIFKKKKRKQCTKKVKRKLAR